MFAPSLADMFGDCIRAAGNHPACDEFFRLVQPTIIRVVSRIARQHNAPAEVDDLIQEVGLKLIASGKSIVGLLPSDGAEAVSYFSVLAANAARDFFRARGAEKRGISNTVSLETPLASFAVGLKHFGGCDMNLLLGEIEDFLPSDPREQIVFRLYYRQGFTAREISAIPAFQLTAKGVESMIFRITREIRERLSAQEKKASSKKSFSKLVRFK